MQLSNALSQEFIRMTVGKREIVVDGTINGMGRGAGNTPTELVAQYMVSQLGYGYDIDAILDIIDGYMDNIRTRCSWGYTTPYFVAGCFSAHVNNIAYLLKKNSIKSKDIRYILNKIGAVARKRYDYDLLERTYMELLDFEMDDSVAIENLKRYIGNREVLVLVPGNTATTEVDKIKSYISEKNPVVISVNYIHEKIAPDFVYMSNVKRYRYWRNNKQFQNARKILTSNITDSVDEKTSVISFIKLVKCGWEHLDNSTIMLLRLLDVIGVTSIAIAGFDGYDPSKNNYATKSLELTTANVDPFEMNRELTEMLEDYRATRVHQEAKVTFVTESRFERCFQ
jgi:4-hydroxy 2-oxovalerate aldolase